MSARFLYNFASFRGDEAICRRQAARKVQQLGDGVCTVTGMPAFEKQSKTESFAKAHWIWVQE